MSRHTGPRVKIMRALGTDLPGLSRKSADRRPYPPGQHGQARRKKLSDFGRQLKEKQKLRLNYGISERQLRRLVAEARSGKMAAGQKLIELVERRLDNAVFRAGLAPTIPAARQLINHGHILINGSRCDVPSARINEGDIIQLREKSRNLQAVKDSVENVSLIRPDWIEFDTPKLTAKITGLPTSDSVPFELEIQLVIEYYAKRL